MQMLSEWNAGSVSKQHPEGGHQHYLYTSLFPLFSEGQFTDAKWMERRKCLKTTPRGGTPAHKIWQGINKTRKKSANPLYLQVY